MIEDEGVELRTLARISAATVVLALAQSSIAEELEELVDATNPEGMISIIQDLGYRAKLDVDNTGDPIIHSSVGGTEFSLQFFGCTEDNNDQCKMLLYKVGYDLDEGSDLKAVNSWNEMTLVARAYLDDESDPWLEWAINMYGGVSRQNFEDTFNWWEIALANFEDHLDH